MTADLEFHTNNEIPPLIVEPLFIKTLNPKIVNNEKFIIKKYIKFYFNFYCRILLFINFFCQFKEVLNNIILIFFNFFIIKGSSKSSHAHLCSVSCSFE